MTEVRKLRILIVDDQRAQTGALCDVLRQYQYDAEGCCSAWSRLCCSATRTWRASS
ncbi:MAG: hypothetical protein K0R43_3446 [Pseudoduganella sp.]|jgi:hypothetical protein|nr:hypothetical protein [Pseudoduganella sp.]